MLETFSTVGKFLSEYYFIIALLILGHIFYRDKFIRPTVALLFAIILVIFLKSIFRAPLPNPDLVGWAFPSGHQTASLVLWMALTWEFKSKIVLLTGILINTLIGYSLIYNNYHYIIDLFGAVITSFAWLWVFYYTLKIWPKRKEAEIFLLYGILGAILNSLIGWDRYSLENEINLALYSIIYWIFSSNKFLTWRQKLMPSSRLD